MRNRFAEVFYELAKQDPRLCAIVADISPAGSIAKFREEYPERFINTGVAEQVMIGMAAGMAQAGLRVFAYTIATFALYRPFEFVRDDLAYQDLPVTIVGIGGGVSYSTLGATHHAQEDIGVACSVPNLRVIAPCDPSEVEAATRWCAVQMGGPVYLRLGKAGEPNLTASALTPWVFGKLRYLRVHDSKPISTSSICILSYGPIMKLALQVADELQARRFPVSVASVHTLKPLDTHGIEQALMNHAGVVVIEETSPEYGLGNQVRAIAQRQGIRKPIMTFGLRNEFTHAYGSHDDVLASHGLTVEAIIKALVQ